MNWKKAVTVSAMAISMVASSFAGGASASTTGPSTLYTNLDYGIYWFGKGNVSQKYVTGQSNPYYSTTKPTVIYVHGWQPGSSQNQTREDFDYEAYNLYNTADEWVSAGWNVGIFYWNQFADEGEVKDAEAKIWTASGPQGMRWRKSDGTYVTYNSNGKSASDLFVEEYTKAMSNYTGNNVRIAGHSLGNQMATLLTKKLSDLNSSGQLTSNKVPKRVALLDPFWSKDGKTYLGGKWTGEVAREYVSALKAKGIVFENYKSSAINDLWIGDANLGMQQMTTFVELAPWYVPQTDQSGKHNVAPRMYFSSFGFNAPEVTIDGWGTRTQTGLYAPNAQMSDSEIGKRMDGGKKWVQVEGRNSQSTDDDWYEVKTK